MKIIVVGAGLGGLSAALCFSRRGHEAEVLEQRSELLPQGSGINVRPAASRIMHEWGLREDLAAISDETLTAFLRDLKTGQMTMRSILMDASAHPGRVPHGTTSSRRCTSDPWRRVLSLL